MEAGYKRPKKWRWKWQLSRASQEVILASGELQFGGPRKHMANHGIKVHDWRKLTKFVLVLGSLWFPNSSILCFTETWLKPDIPDNLIDIAGFDTVRHDRSSSATHKSKGGGVMMYINKRWCQNFKVIKTICDANIELLCVSLRPFYLPREFNQLHVIGVRVCECMHS